MPGHDSTIEASQLDDNPPEAHGRSDSSAGRILGLLDLFTPEAPIWTVEMFQEKLGLARATVYRYARELHQAGFLVPAVSGGYMLGPRFIEFDRQIRLADPLIIVGEPIMRELSPRVAGSQLLCTHYGDRVMTVHEELTDPRLKTSFQRGRPFPLFRGAPSRIILANLPPQHLKNLFLAHSETIAEVGLGKTFTEFRDAMRQIKKNGYYVGSEIDTTLVGVASPIFRDVNSVTGCLCLVRKKSETGAEELSLLQSLAIDAAARISKGIQARLAESSGGATAFPTLRVAL